MLQLFRNMFSSKLGVAITLGLLGVIALAFAAGDVASNGGLSGVMGGDRVASVGKTRLTSADLARAATQSVEGARAQDPRASMKGFLAQGGLESVLGQLIDRTALAAFGADHGIVAGKRLIGSELAKIPALQGPDGRFSDAAYRQLLAQKHLSDDDVQQDIAGGLIGRQVLQPAGLGAVMPDDVVLHYAALLKEHRTGSIALLPAAAFAPKMPPPPAQVAAFYAAHQSAFMQPERRVIRYALFDDSVVKNLPPPSEAQIAARYRANAGQYAASQTRKLTQTIAADQAGARAIAAEVAGGKTLEAAAAARGLSTASLGAMTQVALAAQSAPPVAEAAFTARHGAVAGPVKGGLGWYLLRVDAVDNRAARSLDQAHGEIATAILAEQRKAALADLTVRTQDGFDKGGALSDAAKALGITAQQSAPLTADGKVYGQPAQTAPAQIARIVPAAFQMAREGQPQLAEIEPGKRFAIFDVTQIAPAAPAPLAAIAGDVAGVMMLQQGAAAAQAAALRALGQIKKGTPMGAALGSLGVTLPPVQPVSLGRDQLAAQGDKVPPPLALLFGMAQGTTKLLPMPGNRGWLMVQLAKIEPGAVARADPMFANVAKELGELSGREYADAMRAAIRRDVGAARNPAGIRAVAAQLAGGG